MSTKKKRHKQGKYERQGNKKDKQNKTMGWCIKTESRQNDITKHELQRIKIYIHRQTNNRLYHILNM